MLKEKHCECEACEREHEHEHEHNHEHGHECGDHDEKCCSCCEAKLHGEHEEGELRRNLMKIIPAAVLFIASFFVPDGIIKVLILVCAYLLVGVEVIIGAVKELIFEHSIDEEFLMTIATVGAMAIGEMTEAVAVMLFYSVGELLEDIACERSRKSITALMALRPDEITLKRGGELVKVPVEEAKAGDIAVIIAGERIGVDGVIVRGETAIDNSALTGESIPVSAGMGDPVYGGGINTSGTIEIEITKPYAESSSARILELVENAQDKKAKAERFITRFARKYTVAVVALACFIAFVCPIFTGYAVTFTSWLYRGLTLLVVSCPCAFVISVPLSFFAGIGCASRNGILVKGAASIEVLSKLTAVALDKTGTLTKGSLSVINCDGDPDTLHLAAYAESHSTHPIAKAIVKAYGEKIDDSLISDTVEQAGRGVTATVSGDEITVGRSDSNVAGIAVSVYKNGAEIGVIHLTDELKPDTAPAIAELKNLGISEIVMLSGDRVATAKAVAQEVGIDSVHAELTPDGKCDAMSELIAKNDGKTAFVGDGINDAPVLALSDIGVAMGGLGSDAAIETADVVILDDKLSRLPTAVKVSRRTMKIVYQCVAFAFLAKLAVITLELFGYAGMWAAVFADVGVTVLCILNSLRALNYKIK